MSRVVMVFVGLALVAASCGGSPGGNAVASLAADDATNGPDTSTTVETSKEDAALAFASCMRDQGIEDFRDPGFSSDGKTEFDKPTGDDAEELAAAFEACRSTLEGTTFSKNQQGSDAVEKVDVLLDFATCLRENGFDVPDPDPSTGSFGEIDRTDPDFTAAYEQCSELLSSGK